MNKVGTVVRVGIADLNTVRTPDRIRTLGLGSCVGIVIYDEMKQIAGLAHILLPDSTVTRQKTVNTYKYADTAIPYLVQRLLQMGARHSALKAKIAGGAEMFKFDSGSDLLRIGPRNIEATLTELEKLKIPVIAKDVGGNIGRTIEFNPATSELNIRKVNREEIVM
ncbi:chemotaxis protein CheD [Oceanobacillus alkalisoli]|uniref:chemotaxis protein CheD n=1 Tax=Oceanobacillus alkalisoli TaxID=2925113 RepID=UPI001EF0D9FD|nr:chemotaxis protein CheD [Oceanobacillus alkalisoli]MCF3942410.1 chemotaxis protein CheD [Oceanobacillus alkalisoli]MCG5103467.1 chemotaxis protein CheD [Oceanobacillus alkalisoli]